MSETPEWDELIDEYGTDEDTFVISEAALKAYIDYCIEDWRDSDYEHAEGCIHALQSLRTSFVGEMYPCEVCGKTEPHYHRTDDADD